MLEAGALPESSSCTCAEQPLWGWMASCPSGFPAAAIPGEHGPFVHMLNAVLTAPYTETITLTRLQETLH